MTPDWVEIMKIAVLAIVGIWGIAAFFKCRKSPPKEAPYYGVYLRICLLIGALACLITAFVMILRLAT